jgi:hypothetical protein
LREGIVVVFAAGHYYDRGHLAYPLKVCSVVESAGRMVFGISA